jgi:hypothetical protein
VTYAVHITAEAWEDVERIEAFLRDAARRHGDEGLALRAVDALLEQLSILEKNPFTCRKSDGNPFERELVIPFGSAGFLALFEILGEGEVAAYAVRHQREEDYH